MRVLPPSAVIRRTRSPSNEPSSGEGLRELGANEIVVGLDDIDTSVDVVLDSVGGGHLVTAWSLLRPGGSLQSIGWASGEPATFPPNSTFVPGAAKTLRSFGDASRPGPDLAVLAEPGHS
ncbi:hypothetical protein SMC26_29725 [Actinomadura fulvescens]|uniref:Alcohol dehydrogenase-like C-terminal domain-containing protein n=1 Tax=Actinomadura fulvescens TaxID=46160 RepID=A0ABN3QKL8_9ACTN